MEPLKIAAVQFETRDNDKVYNLSIIREMPESVGRESGCSGFPRMLGLWIYVCQGLVSQRNCWLLPNRSPRGRVRKP